MFYEMIGFLSLQRLSCVCQCSHADLGSDSWILGFLIGSVTASKSVFSLPSSSTILFLFKPILHLSILFYAEGYDVLIRLKSEHPDVGALSDAPQV